MKKPLTDLQWFASTDLSNDIPEDEVLKQAYAIGKWYDKQVSVVNSDTRYMWILLAQESKYQAARLASKYNVAVTRVTGQPYTLPCEMFSDIAQGTLKISIENIAHPIHNLDDTVALRTWHDLTHYEIKANFGFTGEYKTYTAQVQHAKDYSFRNPKLIDHTLYIDIVGQVGNGLLQMVFPIQKVF